MLKRTYLPLIWLAWAATLSAEFLEIRIEVEATDCISCFESLESRLGRVRGVETVELDLDAGTIRLGLEPENQVRLGPLTARVTQDGTKISRLFVRLRGDIRQGDAGLEILPTGLANALPLEGADLPAPGGPYEIEGLVRDGRVFPGTSW